MTTFLLSHNKINTPNTWVPEKLNKANKIIKSLIKKKNQVIWKPLFGSQGKDLKIITEIIITKVDPWLVTQNLIDLKLKF